MAAPRTSFTSASFTLRGRTITVDLPHLLFATAIVGWCVWYCFDAWSAQRDVENLIMILPGSAAAVILYLFVAVKCFRVGGAEARPPLAPGLALKIAGTMALLGAYAMAAPLIGFDVVSFVYVLAMLLFLGERRPLVLITVPALFCALAIYCFDTILATPLPLLFFSDAGS
jgi:hypothetical protein